MSLRFIFIRANNTRDLTPERWLSGLKHTPGKREWAYTPPWVQIPVSPPENGEVGVPERSEFELRENERSAGEKA